MRVPRPKSSSTSRPDPSMSTLSGLISRCTSLFAWSQRKRVAQDRVMRFAEAPEIALVAAPHMAKKCRPAHQFHGEEPELAIFEQVVELDQVGVSQSRQAPEFLLETEESVGMRIPQDLDRDVVAAFLIVDLIHGSESTPSQTAGNSEPLRKTDIDCQSDGFEKLPCPPRHWLTRRLRCAASIGSSAAMRSTRCVRSSALWADMVESSSSIRCCHGERNTGASGQLCANHNAHAMRQNPGKSYAFGRSVHMKEREGLAS